MEASMTQLELQEYYMLCIERLRGGGIERLSWDAVHGLLNKLLEGVPVVPQQIMEGSVIIRGRKLSDAHLFADAKHLSYPPADKCSHFGRCNRPNSPMLYAGGGYGVI